jgi:hypothetical protein
LIGLNQRETILGREWEKEPMPEDIKTDSKLIERLRNSGRYVTREQLRRQRVSYIMGSLPQDSTITRREIERILEQNEGDSAAA